MEKGERILVPLDGLKCAETIIPRVDELVSQKKWNSVLNLNPNGTKRDLEKAMEGHIISRAQLTGSYKRD